MSPYTCIMTEYVPVAAAKMTQLAGADRVEGCLFGNGDRAGSVGLGTLALNLYSQGVQPGVNLGSLDDVVAQVEELMQIPVHRRAPYSGRNVSNSYTETQHEAIYKGYQSLGQDQSQPRSKHQGQGQEPEWKISYIPMDPTDIGRHDEHTIRVNRHSGTIHHVKQILHIDMHARNATRIHKYCQRPRHEARLRSPTRFYPIPLPKEGYE